MIGLSISVLLSIVMSALCSITEAVLYSVSWSHIEQLKETRPKIGTLLYTLRSNIDESISVILTINTLANTAGATISGALATRLWGDDFFPVFAITFTIAILLFSEIIPKTLGVVYSKTISLYIVYPLLGFIYILKPLSLLIRKLTVLIAPTKEPEVTEEDIRSAVTMSRRNGKIESYEALAINNILSLDTKEVKDVMTPRTVVFSLPADSLSSEVQNERDFWNHTRIPIYDKNNEDIVGIVTRQDIFQMTADGVDLPLRTIMKPVHFVLETTTLDKLLQQFLAARTHLFIVLDEYSGLAGVVSLEDILEEILGREIIDETDKVVDLQQVARQRQSVL
ncbi:MAG: hemolysin family protein [Desulfovibrionaceae bacterium]